MHTKYALSKCFIIDYEHQNGSKTLPPSINTEGKKMLKTNKQTKTLHILRSFFFFSLFGGDNVSFLICQLLQMLLSSLVALLHEIQR